ncbi:MAG: 4a-hydroxytetrahydrobiopterin dehydratase [archaeon]|nr:4a-hydroxytetrahydrobiopterin dehydratase [archaeon]
MDSLSEKHCTKPKETDMPLQREKAKEFAAKVPTWTLEVKKISRRFQFDDFEKAMEFANKVAAIAKEQDHHPNIHISYNKVMLELSTHKIGGLHKNDFILAAKIDKILN